MARGPAMYTSQGAQGSLLAIFKSFLKQQIPKSSTESSLYLGH